MTNIINKVFKFRNKKEFNFPEEINWTLEDKGVKVEKYFSIFQNQDDVRAENSEGRQSREGVGKVAADRRKGRALSSPPGRVHRIWG